MNGEPVLTSQQIRKQLEFSRKSLKGYAVNFRHARFSFKKKRITSTTDPRYYLQWQTRRFPHLPVSFENQQTSVGYVELYAPLPRDL